MKFENISVPLYIAESKYAVARIKAFNLNTISFCSNVISYVNEHTIRQFVRFGKRTGVFWPQQNYYLYSRQRHRNKIIMHSIVHCCIALFYALCLGFSSPYMVYVACQAWSCRVAERL